jgi:hypothetical protein
LKSIADTSIQWQTDLLSPYIWQSPINPTWSIEAFYWSSGLFKILQSSLIESGRLRWIEKYPIFELIDDHIQGLAVVDGL